MSNTVRDGPIVTLDGPAGSGKSSTAREVARRLGFRHLDSGALYRALTHALLQNGRPPDTWETLTWADLSSMGLEMRPADAGFDVVFAGRRLHEELRGPEVTGLVSRLARLEPVRQTVFDLLREAGRAGRVVADGRDMGTVVFPDADVKVFLVADLGERARRRLRERGHANPTPVEVAREAEAIAARDRTDSEREHAPLRRAEDATPIDTTLRSFDEQVAAIVDLVRLRAPLVD